MSGSSVATRGLTVASGTTGAGVRLLDDITFEVEAGGSLGLVGESGSGKSMTLYALAGLLPSGVQVVSGDVTVGYQHFAADVPRGFRRLRGRQIGFVFQDPARALNPLRKVGKQVSEGPILHLGKSRAAARVIALEWLGRVGLPDPKWAYDVYPHQLSGGMRQRVMIAAALSTNPDILLADEPTTALDVTIQAQILALLHELRHELGITLVFVSHDLAVVSQICERVGVLYAGQLVEIGPTTVVLREPRHAYTRALLDAIPDGTSASGLLPAVPGVPPDPAAPPSGCRFHPRCAVSLSDCASVDPALKRVADGHLSSCVHAEHGLPLSSLSREGA